ncbi:MAG: di-heme oxidoredictase family protein [Gemmatimonadota bacterium]
MHRLAVRSILSVMLAVLASACSDRFLPGAPDDALLLDGPVAGLAGAQVALHARGDGEFGRRFATIDGLGPLFVATSCDGCHVGEGKGHPAFDLTRFGRMVNGTFDPMEAEGGPQLQNRAVLGYLAEQMPGGLTAVARFTAPSVTGLGFLEAVDDTTILALADPTDADGDGVSGRAALLDSTELIGAVIAASAVSGGPTPSRVANGKYLGRFGKKSRLVNLLHQTVFAYSEDMGVTTDQVPRDLYNRQLGVQAEDAAPDPEVSASVVNAVVFYLRTLRAPPRRQDTAADVVEGGRLFVQVGCASCHRPSMKTGRSDVPQLDRVEFAPFTDLLLHDMGPELNDGYTEGDAAPAEWRTAPLWGLGLAARAQGGGTHFLHDGRAPSLRDAIRFHGGEGSRSRAAFDALPAPQQELLLAYLRSL